MIETIAFGLELRLLPTEAGGRTTPIVASGSKPFLYRPNWGLPSMEPPEQTGALVLGFGADTVDPGGPPVRAVIVVPFPGTIARWEAEVGPGTSLPMYEGPRVHGTGTVVWRRPAHYPLSPAEHVEFSAWLGEAEVE